MFYMAVVYVHSAIEPDNPKAKFAYVLFSTNTEEEAKDIAKEYTDEAEKFFPGNRVTVEIEPWKNPAVETMKELKCTL